MVCTCQQTKIIYIYIYIYTVHMISFQTFFSYGRILLIVHAWNTSPLRSNLLQLQCTCCTVPTTSGRPHGSPLVCQWPSSQPLSSPQLSHNDSLWAYGIIKSHTMQDLDYREGEELSWSPSWSNLVLVGCIPIPVAAVSLNRKSYKLVSHLKRCRARIYWILKSLQQFSIPIRKMSGKLIVCTSYIYIYIYNILYLL